MATVSLITNVFIPRSEAISRLEDTLSIQRSGENLADASLRLDHDIVLTIEVPKFGEDLPLTLDLTGEDRSEVLEAARTLSVTLRSSLNWKSTVYEL
jgi:hypothetical protein